MYKNHFFFLDYFFAFYINHDTYCLGESFLSEPNVLLFVFVFVGGEEFVDGLEVNSMAVEYVFGVFHGPEGLHSRSIVSSVC